MRKEIIAEHATYKLDNPACEMKQYKTYDEVCSVMRGTTVHFVGDSIVDQIYTTTLKYLKQGDLKRMLVPVGEDVLEQCKGDRLYIKRCRRYSKRIDSEECGGTATIRSLVCFR